VAADVPETVVKPRAPGVDVDPAAEVRERRAVAGRIGGADGHDASGSAGILRDIGTAVAGGGDDQDIPRDGVIDRVLHDVVVLDRGAHRNADDVGGVVHGPDDSRRHVAVGSGAGGLRDLDRHDLRRPGHACDAQAVIGHGAEDAGHPRTVARRVGGVIVPRNDIPPGHEAPSQIGMLCVDPAVQHGDDDVPRTGCLIPCRRDVHRLQIGGLRLSVGRVIGNSGGPQQLIGRRVTGHDKGNRAHESRQGY
jgi:hypothetical protein